MATPVHAAAERLRGHLVTTPLIGDLRLPAAAAVSAAVRVKVECVQVAGSVWYRGYLHYLLRSLGRFKGLVLRGGPRAILAQAIAGAEHRLPMIAVTDALPSMLAELLATTGCEVRAVAGGDAAAGDAAAELATELARDRGFQLAPTLAEPAVFEGIATLGLELAKELPAEVRRVVVSPAELAEPIRAGLAAHVDGEPHWSVHGVSPPPSAPASFRAAVLAGLRVDCDPEGLLALWREREATTPTCVVLTQ